jgi:hypothetical protein
VRIVLGNSSGARYPQGGGLWSWLLQYPLALKALRHDVFWLEVLESTGRRDEDVCRISDFFARLAAYDLDRNCAVLLFHEKIDSQPIEKSEVFGRGREDLLDVIRSTDLLLNICCSLRPPLLSLFKRSALLDCDPGHLQVSALKWDLGIRDHDVCLTIGSRINAPDSEIPTLGLQWRICEPFVYTPIWQSASDPGRDAPFTSITQWGWEELLLGKKVLSVSKRAAYLKYVDLPRLARRPFELAANIGDADVGGDRPKLSAGGWKIVDPHEVAPTPEKYQKYISASRAELMCPKPIHVQIKTGWFSERSIAYLASGRPVLAEETGFSERLPTGAGLIAFRNIDEAVAGVAEIDANYELHRRAARALAEDHFNWRACAEAMLSACEP